MVFFYLIFFIILVLDFSYYVINASEIYPILYNIFYGYLGFISWLNIIYFFVTYEKSVEFKNNNPFLYNCLFLFSVGLLLIFAWFFFYYVEKLTVYLLKFIVGSFKGYVLKMLGIQPPKPLGLGGKTESGGGGKPPKKPGGPNPLKGHYVEKEKRRRANYSKMTPKEIAEYKENLRKAKNERRRVHNLSEEEHNKRLEADRARHAKQYANISPEEEGRLRDIYNRTRRIGYEERKVEINARRREIFAEKSDDEKEFIRENDRERYHNSSYMRLQKQKNKRRSRANLKKKDEDKE